MAWYVLCAFGVFSNSWKPEGIRTKGFWVYMGFVPECIREGEPRNPPYMDSTSVASPLIAEVIGGWGESFSLWSVLELFHTLHFATMLASFFCT